MKPEKNTGMLRKNGRVLHGIVQQWEAKAQGLPRFYTGYPCGRDHIAERDTRTGECVECRNEPSSTQRRGIPSPHTIPLWKARRKLEQQGGRCPLCQDPITLPIDPEMAKRTAFIDHCHVTGRFRGVLCHRCNTGLGQFRDNGEALERAIKYLREVD